MEDRLHGTRAAGITGMLLFLALFAVPAGLNAQIVHIIGGEYQYSVKVMCGTPDYPVLAPGEYFTAVNVHNPNPDAVKFRKKVAVALPGETPGRISEWFPAVLKPDQAFEIDCPDILKHARHEGFLKGFVVIESPLELDVVAVYSAAECRVEALHTERVPYRRIARPDVIEIESDHCPPGAMGDRVGREGCCCNRQRKNGKWWPDCAPGLTCVGNLAGPGLPASTYAVCTSKPSAPVSAPIHWSQPPFCDQ